MKTLSLWIVLFLALPPSSYGSRPDKDGKPCANAGALVPSAQVSEAAVIAALKKASEGLPQPIAADNAAFQASYHRGSVEVRANELGYLDFKGVRMEVKFGDKTFVLHAEVPLLKKLNDELFKTDKAGTDVIAAMVNRAVEAEFGPNAALRKELADNPGRAEELFARASQRAVERIEKLVADVPGLAAYLARFNIEPSQLVGVGWADRAVGGGYGDVAASLAARFTRKRSRGDNAWRSFLETHEIINKNLQSMVQVHQSLSGDFVFLFRNEDGVPSLQEGVYELVRKFPNGPELRGALRRRYGEKLTDKAIEQIVAYANLVDGLASPIFAEKPTPLPWSEKGAALTGDLVGGGAENLAELERELLVAADHPTPSQAANAAAAGSRTAEQKVTVRMGKKKDHFVEKVTAWVDAEAARLGVKKDSFKKGHSADDMLAMIPPELLADPAAIDRLATALHSEFPGRIRLTLGPDSYRDSGKPVPIAVKKIISGSLEVLQKKALLLAEEVGVPYSSLKNALVMPKAVIDEKTGAVTIQLIVKGVEGRHERALVDAFVALAKKESTGDSVRSWSIGDPPVIVR